MKLINREEFFCRRFLREFAGLEKEVVIVGVANRRMEIWSKERWQECIEQHMMTIWMKWQKIWRV